MHRKSLNNKIILKRSAVYLAMTISVVAIVTFVVFFISGYRFDASAGHIEQYAMFQFNSNPTGATISIDGKQLNVKTPNKAVVTAGSHTVTISKNGYEAWTKQVSVKSGVLSWLNYALLVPQKLTVESVASYPLINATLASPDGRYMLIQGQPDLPVFDVADLGSDTIKVDKLTIPASIYSDSSTLGIAHGFTTVKWDNGGRYVLIKHTYGDKIEWLVLDTQDANLTKNITQLFDLAISNIEFAGTSGNVFLALSNKDVRKIDLSAGTISRPLVSGAVSFSLYGSNIISYVGENSTANQLVVGLYRDGDDNSHVIKTITKTDSTAVNVTVARYFNEYYLVIADGKKVSILNGSYPSSVDDTSSLKAFASFTADEDIKQLSFSPSGEYVLVQSDAYFASYDLEYKLLTPSSVKGNGSVSILRWLNDDYLYSDRDGSLAIFEFDGNNIHVINPVIIGQSAVLTDNGRYIYSINKTDTDYQLQRVRMILP